MNVIPATAEKNISLIFVSSYHVLFSLATKIIVSWEVTLRSWADRCACFAVMCCPLLQGRTDILFTFCEWRFYQNTRRLFYKAIMSTVTAVAIWKLISFLLEGCLTVHLPHEMWNANLMQQGNFIDVFFARNVSGTYGSLKTTTHPETRCRKPYTATQPLMLLMMCVCTRNMSRQEYINKIT